MLVNTDSNRSELSRHLCGRGQMFPLGLAGTTKRERWNVSIRQAQIELTDRPVVTNLPMSASAMEDLAPGDTQPPQRRIG